MNRPRFTTAQKVGFLRLPASYAAKTRRVDVIETHFAWIFLTDRYAYKMKKPVRQRSMEYRTLPSRQRACRNEVRLNRRLAPEVYLGVVPLSRTSDGSLTLGHGTQVIEWLVRMRRLPAARMLDNAIAADRVTRRDLDAVITRLSRFYRHARRQPMSPREYVSLQRRLTSDNHRELRAPDLRLDQRMLQAAVAAQMQFIAANEQSLGERAARLVEGHGDLRPEHIYLGSGSLRTCVIDCLEFDPRLRRLDPAEEIAFLALECRRLGAGQLGSDLLRGMRVALADPVPDEVIFFYLSQRALTRAKIAAWHLRDPQQARRAGHWRARARQYLTDALHWARLRPARHAEAFSESDAPLRRAPSVASSGC